VVGVHDSVHGVDLEVLVGTDGGSLLDGSPVGEGWLTVVEVLVGHMLDVVGVHPRDTLGNLSTGHSAAKVEQLSSSLRVEVVRGRNSLWNSLMKTESSEALNSEAGAQMLHLGRRVTRTEVAQRVSWMDAYHIKHMANEHFYDSEPSFTNWGAIE
jgi:hypothetical protein